MILIGNMKIGFLVGSLIGNLKIESETKNMIEENKEKLIPFHEMTCEQMKSSILILTCYMNIVG